jgi:hypothetical protein
MSSHSVVDRPRGQAETAAQEQREAGTAARAKLEAAQAKLKGGLLRGSDG